MPVEELMWEVLGTQLGRDGTGAAADGRPGDDARREAAVQLLDAAAAALAATGHLVSAAELVVRDQRDRLAGPADGRGHDDQAPQAPDRPTHIALTY